MSASLDSELSNLVIEDIIKSVSNCEIDPEVLQTLETIWKKKFSEAFSKEGPPQQGKVWSARSLQAWCAF